MKHQDITKPQTVKACTLISIAAIYAILKAENEAAMLKALAVAQEESQVRYNQLLIAARDHGDGLLEDDAYRFNLICTPQNGATESACKC